MCLRLQFYVPSALYTKIPATPIQDSPITKIPPPIKIGSGVIDNVVFTELFNFPDAFVGQETAGGSYHRQR